MAREIDKSRIDKTGPVPASYWKEVESWSKRHGFFYTDKEVETAWRAGVDVETFILEKCGRR